MVKKAKTPINDEATKLWQGDVWFPIEAKNGTPFGEYGNLSKFSPFEEYQATIFHNYTATYIAIIYRDRSDAMDYKTGRFITPELHHLSDTKLAFHRVSEFVAVSRIVLKGPRFVEEKAGAIRDGALKQVAEMFLQGHQNVDLEAEKIQRERERNRSKQKRHLTKRKELKIPDTRDIYRAHFLAAEGFRQANFAKPQVAALFDRIADKTLDFLEDMGFDRELSEERRKALYVTGYRRLNGK